MNQATAKFYSFFNAKVKELGDLLNINFMQTCPCGSFHHWVRSMQTRMYMSYMVNYLLLHGTIIWLHVMCEGIFLFSYIWRNTCMQVGKYFLAKDIHKEIFLDLLYLKIYGIFKREDFGFPAWWNCHCWISRRFLFSYIWQKDTHARWKTFLSERNSWWNLFGFALSNC
jgi:hypothetical protein